MTSTANLLWSVRFFSPLGPIAIMRPPKNDLRCICAVTSGRDQVKISAPADVDPNTRKCLGDALHTSMEKICPADTWTGSCHMSSCPYPVLVNQKHQSQLQKLNKALVTAITDIVSRWWTDRSARFPERMPLQPMEEKLLCVSGPELSKDGH